MLHDQNLIKLYKIIFAKMAVLLAPPSLNALFFIPLTLNEDHRLSHEYRFLDIPFHCGIYFLSHYSH